MIRRAGHLFRIGSYRRLVQPPQSARSGRGNGIQTEPSTDSTRAPRDLDIVRLRRDRKIRIKRTMKRTDGPFNILPVLR